MARKAEEGLLYFPMNTDIIHNPKLKLVVSEFKSKSWAVILPMYCKIYREKGYYVDWFNDDIKLLFAEDEAKSELGFVNEVIAGCIRRGVFNKSVFDLFGVLTTDRIQENFIEAKKRNKNVEMIRQFLLIPQSVYNKHQNVNIINLNVNIISKKVNIGTQKKKEIIEGEGEGEKVSANAPTDDEIKFQSFNEWILKNTPRVAKMKKPLTLQEFTGLREKIPKEVLQKVLFAMENYGELLKKYVSANLTIQKWSKTEMESQKKSNGYTTTSTNSTTKHQGDSDMLKGLTSDLQIIAGGIKDYPA
ncbi:MAG: hypothetical protein NVSMB45_15080 [Ginsengibacter sp.]